MGEDQHPQENGVEVGHERTRARGQHGRALQPGDAIARADTDGSCVLQYTMMPTTDFRRIGVLLTCHNRRTQTVNCLKALDASFQRSESASYHAYVTDDGSTDGTSEAIRSLGFPITVLHGAGDLFWNRGMVNSWKAAEMDEFRFDGFLLLNDDTLLDEDAISILLAASQNLSGDGIIVGAVRDPDTGNVTYGGVLRTSRWHPGRTRKLDASPHAQPADTFNANCVYVPAAVARSVGTLDPVFQHSMGDFDYGYRAKERGYHVVVAPNTVGACGVNTINGTWQDPSQPLRRRLELLASPKGLPFAEWREFLRRHGALAPSILAAAPYLRVVASSLLRARRRPGSDAATEP